MRLGYVAPWYDYDGMIVVAIIGLMLLYLGAAFRQRAGKRPWSIWRSASFSFGIAMLLLATAPPVSKFAHHNLNGHMAQHLLLGMFAPLGLVFAAPVTLTLRTVPAPISRRLVSLLRTPAVRVASHPVSALFLNVGGMYLLYLTPLYAKTLTSPLLHILVHIHFLIAGCLFTWAVAGPDPGPHRPGIKVRLGLLFVSMALHSTLAKLMYAYGFPKGTPHGAAEIQQAAQLMYYGGDLAEVCLAIGLFAIWYRDRTRSCLRMTSLE